MLISHRPAERDWLEWVKTWAGITITPIQIIIFGVIKMTNQDLFTRIASNLQAYDQLQATIDQDITGHTDGLHWASGDLLTERWELMAEYAQSDMIIFRCNECGLFWLPTNLEPYMSHGLPTDRLMIDGTWQTQAERDELNQVAYQRMAG